MPPFFVQYVQTLLSGPFSLMQQVVWAVVPSGATHGFNLSGHLRFRHCGQSCLPMHYIQGAAANRVGCGSMGPSMEGLNSDSLL